MTLSQAGILCGEHCKCTGCKNTADSAERQALVQLATGQKPAHPIAVNPMDGMSIGPEAFAYAASGMLSPATPAPMTPATPATIAPSPLSNVLQKDFVEAACKCVSSVISTFSRSVLTSVIIGEWGTWHSSPLRQQFQPRPERKPCFSKR